MIDLENSNANFVIPPPPPMPPPQQLQNPEATINISLSTRLPHNSKPNSPQKTIESSDYCTINEIRQQIHIEDTSNSKPDTDMSPNSLKNFMAAKVKTVAFREGPPCLIESNSVKGEETLMRKSSLGRYSSRSELSLSSKGRRKSLTNYLTEKAQFVSKTSKLFNSKSTNQLKEPDSHFRSV